MFCWQSCLVGRWGECYLVEQVFLLLCKFTVTCSVHCACMFANILHRIILMLKLRLISEWPWCPAYWPRCPLIIFKSQGQLALPSNCPDSRPGALNGSTGWIQNFYIPFLQWHWLQVAGVCYNAGRCFLLLIGCSAHSTCGVLCTVWRGASGYLNI